ncbi:MAG TPA: PBP1A family penicillin-binding protein [Caulobacteraceae bacterium]|nr:PBP1A family penicillin-binding protein [Caulobacteraceae bacterium]
MTAAVYAAVLFHGMPNPADLVDYHPPTSTRIYAWDGTQIGEASTDERRIYVPFDQMPPKLYEAFLAAEDHNFFSHGGVDVAGVSRAMIKDVFNVLQGRRPEGGSTITQQVAKNILLNNDVSVGRKLKEAILATQLEQTVTKQRILELYLNEIWLGYRSYGVGAAAFNYFGKPVSELSLAECAYLAALPKGPDNYHPVRHKDAAIRRRNAILKDMADLGFVSRADALAAMREDLTVQAGPARSKYRDADYFVDWAQRTAVTEVKDLKAGGYYMRTTLDPRLQTAARIALMDGLETYDRRHGWRGAWGHLSAVSPGWQKAAIAAAQSPKVRSPAERRDWRIGAVTSTGGAVKVETVDGLAGDLIPADVAWARAGKGLSVGDLVYVEPAEGGGLHLRQVPIVNGALVAMEPNTGRVLAMVGGYSFSLSNFNRATQAYRQPGSSFKPFVYATALETGQFTPASIVVDGPVSLPGAAPGQMWNPENYEHDYLGPLVFRRGLELSRNTMTVRIAMQIGMPKIVDTAKKFGVVDKMDPVLAMALGAGETTPWRMAAGYSTFLNGGRKITPHVIEELEDRNGKIKINADHRDCPGCTGAFTGDFAPQIQPDGAQLIDPITAYQIETMLQGVTIRGTAAAAGHVFGQRPIGGKTGTTNEFRSAWFVGFSPQIVVATYVGFDDNRSLGHGETGAVAALPIWIEFMQEAVKTMPALDFKAPANAKFAMVGPNREAFRPGTEPSARIATTGVSMPGGGAAAAITPIAPPAPGGPKPPAGTAPPKADRPPKKQDDLSGLY